MTPNFFFFPTQTETCIVSVEGQVELNSYALRRDYMNHIQHTPDAQDCNNASNAHILWETRTWFTLCYSPREQQQKSKKERKKRNVKLRNKNTLQAKLLKQFPPKI